MHFEPLERRRLMAGVPGYVFTITGTSAADSISLSQSGTTLTVVKNGVLSTHALSGFTGGPTPGSGTPWTISKIVVDALGGHDTVVAAPSLSRRMEVFGGAGNDSIIGGSGSDLLYGGRNGTSSTLESGNDTIRGAAGNDVLGASAFNSAYLYGEADNDTLVGGSSTDFMYGGAGNDSLAGFGSRDYQFGDAGHDTLRGGTGNDAMQGGADNDVLEGEQGADSMLGGLGHDTLVGGDNNDTIKGEGGNDSLNGAAHDDSLDGGLGDDWLVGGAGGDRIIGSIGSDTVTYADRSANLRIVQDGLTNDGASGEGDNVDADIEVILAGSGNDFIQANYTNNWIDGGFGNDTIRGGLGHDTILGGSGHDALHGESGNDWVYGYHGHDNLFAGPGNDVLQGESGNDTMVSIGGGALDQLYGQGGFDSFWLDADGSETHDATSGEVNARNLHRVGWFSNGASKELNGQNLPDPAVVDGNEGWMGTQATDANPLFSSLGPTMDDINQGLLGDCWFLATLSAVAKSDPNVIRQSVVDLGDGTYAAMFFSDGARRYYRVDNDLPVTAGTSNIAYAQPGVEGALWGPILEKAYALHGGEAGGAGEYAEIEGGWSEDAFTDLNIGSDEIDVDDSNVLQTIANHLAAGRPVTIDSISGDFNMGDSIVLSHQYVVRSVNVSAGTISLYNPWGTDAGGGFVQGSDDGFVTFNWNQAFRDLTEDFTVGFV